MEYPFILIIKHAVFLVKVTFSWLENLICHSLLLDCFPSNETYREKKVWKSRFTPCCENWCDCFKVHIWCPCGSEWRDIEPGCYQGELTPLALRHFTQTGDVTVFMLAVWLLGHLQVILCILEASGEVVLERLAESSARSHDHVHKLNLSLGAVRSGE